MIPRHLQQRRALQRRIAAAAERLLQSSARLRERQGRCRSVQRSSTSRVGSVTSQSAAGAHSAWRCCRPGVDVVGIAISLGRETRVQFGRGDARANRLHVSDHVEQHFDGGRLLHQPHRVGQRETEAQERNRLSTASNTIDARTASGQSGRHWHQGRTTARSARTRCPATSARPVRHCVTTTERQTDWRRARKSSGTARSRLAY